MMDRASFFAIPAAGAAMLFGLSAPLPAQAPTTQQVTVRGQQPLPPYRINSGDELEIYVWGDERLQRQLKVLPDGSFAFPLAGTVRAIGRTPTEVEAELSKLLAPQYKGVAPQVTISVRNAAGMSISVIGKVRNPGTFTPSRYINVLDALTLAGGPSDFADVSNIVVLRRENGRVVAIRSRGLNAVLKGRPNTDDLSDNGIPELQSGDTVIVP